jgi:hypothetical protein
MAYHLLVEGVLGTLCTLPPDLRLQMLLRQKSGQYFGGDLVVASVECFTG